MCNIALKMNWKEGIDKNIIIKIPDDEGRSDQMQAMADIRMEFWKKSIEEKYTALKVEAYYDIIKELIKRLGDKISINIKYTKEITRRKIKDVLRVLTEPPNLFYLQNL